MDFKRASAAELWAGRIVPSRHNTSAPDMVFRDFSAASALTIPFNSANAPANGWKREAHDVLAGRHDDGAEQHVGLEDFRGLAVDARPPPRMPDVVEHQEAAARRIGLDRDVGVVVAQDARGAAGARTRRAGRRVLQQHRAARIDVRPAAVADHLVEIGLAPFRRQHHARQRARIFVDIGVLGARDEIRDRPA